MEQAVDNMQNYMQRATILAEALPYIQKYNGKTVVVKYGGNAMVSDTLRDAVISDILLLHLVGIRVIMVHGGGPEIGHMLDKLGKKSRFVNGLRYTDEETMDVVQQVLCGKINKNLVATINRMGAKAIGLCGLDGGLLQAKKLSDRYGLVGEITKVCPQILNDALEQGYIPVISTVALGVDADTSYNINADTAAAELAVAVSAEKLILLTDVKGVLRDHTDESTLIPQIRLGDIKKLMQDGVIGGGMIPKIDCCVSAIRGGVHRTHILDGRIPHSILIEMLSHKGIGTMIFD